MSDPRTCPHCGDTPAPDSRCGCGWIQHHGHAGYTAILERENADLRDALQNIVDNGDYTAPEGMMRIAKKALKENGGAVDNGN